MLPKNIESVALTARWGWDCLAILLQHRASRVDTVKTCRMVGSTRAGALPKTGYSQLSSTATRPLGKERFPIFHRKFQARKLERTAIVGLFCRAGAFLLQLARFGRSCPPKRLCSVPAASRWHGHILHHKAISSTDSVKRHGSCFEGVLRINNEVQPERVAFSRSAGPLVLVRTNELWRP
jgi:hypothetical protein